MRTFLFSNTRVQFAPFRHERAMKETAFDLIRNLPILETQSADFLKVLETGTVATNVFLRRIHNFALDMNWLHWPKVRFKEKRVIMPTENFAIITGEQNPERCAFYECCWHIGGAQSDIAALPSGLSSRALTSAGIS